MLGEADCGTEGAVPDGIVLCMRCSFEVRLSSLLQACFLARISEMWETEKDGLKMMRCRWFCRPGETLLSDHSAAISIAEHPREVFLDESGCDENFMTTIGWCFESSVIRRTTCYCIPAASIPNARDD